MKIKPMMMTSKFIIIKTINICKNSRNINIKFTELGKQFEAFKKA